VYNHITAVQEANRLADIEKFRAPVHYSDRIRDKKSKGTNEFSPYVPYSVVFFDQLVQDILDPACEDPHGMIEQHRSFLEEISFGTYHSEANLDSEFFEVESSCDVDDSSSREDEMLNPIMSGDFDG